MNPVLKYVHHELLDTGRHWYQFQSVLYITCEYNLQCPYCSDGFGRLYHALDRATLSSVEVIAILQRIRRFCNRMVITGGKPTLHPGLGAILEVIPDRGFALAIDYPPSLLLDECTIFFEGVRKALSLHH